MKLLLWKITKSDHIFCSQIVVDAWAITGLHLAWLQVNYQEMFMFYAKNLSRDNITCTPSPCVCFSPPHPLPLLLLLPLLHWRWLWQNDDKCATLTFPQYVSALHAPSSYSTCMSVVVEDVHCKPPNQMLILASQNAWGQTAYCGICAEAMHFSGRAVLHVQCNQKVFRPFTHFTFSYVALLLK